MLEDSVEKIGKVISQRQEKLRRINPNSPLLKMIELTSFGLNYDFSGPEAAKYIGKSKGEALEEYSDDLQKAIETASS